MAYYTVYYTLQFYPYKSLIYMGFSAARFSDDPIIGPDKRQRMLNRYPNAKHLSFDIGGHYPHVTRAADLATLVRTWLKLA
jgi:hypothetical protein